jgi:hypothetical protein
MYLGTGVGADRKRQPSTVMKLATMSSTVSALCAASPTPDWLPTRHRRNALCKACPPGLRPAAGSRQCCSVPGLRRYLLGQRNRNRARRRIECTMTENVDDGTFARQGLFDHRRGQGDRPGHRRTVCPGGRACCSPISTRWLASRRPKPRVNWGCRWLSCTRMSPTRSNGTRHSTSARSCSTVSTCWSTTLAWVRFATSSVRAWSSGGTPWFAT